MDSEQEFPVHENIANYYIQKVQETRAKLEAINQAVKRFNQALGCQQGGERPGCDQAKKAVAIHPNFVKAYQLLTLIYLDTEQYSKARQSIRIAHKLDKTDEITLRYMHEMNQVRKSRTAKIKEKEGKEQQTVTYNIGNETIIQPVSSSYKDNAGLHTIVNIAIGLVVGVAVMWFLIMPAITASRQDKTNRQTVEFSDQIATQKAQISALKKELEDYRSTSEETESAQATAASTQESYEIVMNISAHVNKNDMSDAAMLEELLKVNPDSLGTVGRERFEEITGDLYPRMCTNLFATSQQNFASANYDTAITNLEQVMKMDEGYNDGAAMLLLAQSYEKKGDQDQANVKYQKIIESYPSTDAAEAAQQALDAQNSGKAQDGGQDDGQSGTGE